MKFKKLLVVIFLPVLITSCGNDPATEEDVLGESTNEVTSKTAEQQKISAQNVFNSIPGPSELSRLVEDAAIEYDPAMPNDPGSLHKYTSDNLKALNLGVYGAGMAYANVYEQSQDALLYLKCVNSLCKNLGISGVFDDKTADRLQTNKDNKDSLLTIVSKSFQQADKFLRENQRPHTSSLMVAGGWTEGLYLSAKVAVKSKNKKFIKKMSEQGKSLTDLISMVETAAISGDGAFIVNGLKDLKTSYDKIPDGTTMDDAMLTEIDQKVTALRKKIIME
ncbi:MAG TPA: hypothetical protein VNY73_02165 [Bacteroidia bacterium]|nr:hypothetical protein [Bacteroidia bacterium]